MRRRIWVFPTWLWLIVLLLAAILGPLIPILVMASKTNEAAWALVAQVLGGVGALFAAGMAAIAVRNTWAALQIQRRESQLAKMPVFAVTRFTDALLFTEIDSADDETSYGIQIAFKNFGTGSAVFVLVEVESPEEITARIYGTDPIGPGDTGILAVYFPEEFRERAKDGAGVRLVVRGVAPNLGAAFRQALFFNVIVSEEDMRYLFIPEPLFEHPIAFRGLWHVDRDESTTIVSGEAN